MMENFDNGPNKLEGWFISSSTEHDAHFLGRQAASGIFERDADAWTFVIENALAGRSHHIAALRFIAANDSDEWAFLETHAAYMTGDPQALHPLLLTASDGGRDQ